jgi:CRISPR-associated protein Cas1
VFGNVQLSTQALRALLSGGIPVGFFTTGGWFVGRTIANDTNNVELRVAQYRASLDEHFRLRIARTLVHNKILNQRTLLRRNHASPPATTLFELKQLARKAREASSRQSLLGIEGTAARVYFGELTGMLKGDAAIATFDLDGRNRRPPRDPMNALLSFEYALLVKDWTIALQLVGLDPLLGFFHEPRFGRPALALDLMEPFRPIIADSVVIGAINNGEVTVSDFVISPVGCALRPHARRRMMGAHERRMSHEITHPIFNYRVSYRRALELQARLLGRHLLGELDTYPELRTR